LNDLNSVQNRRLASLNNPKNRDAYQAVQWLQQHKNRFKMPIFGPPMLYLGLKDKSLAAIAESCFRESDLLTFTCLCREDYVKFCALTLDDDEKIFQRKLDLRVSDFSGTGKKLDDWRSPCSAEQMKRLGFDGFLKDVLTGPPEVLNTLCHTNSIHTLVFPSTALM
jgi:structural maintenance of chromosomes protein 5